MKKKIKDLTIKEFYKKINDTLNDVKKSGLYKGKNPLTFVRDISIKQYLEENGEKEVEVDE